ncbi:MAG: hypothetical protein KDD61_05710, partial [Bdellovibrionales bacterium]|nr:hypothetical protein [Bdellovibrionales bacterium]
MRQIIWTILCVSLGTAHTASAKSAMFNQKWQLPNEVIHFETLSSDSNITISTSTSLLKTLAINESKESRSPASWFDWVPTGAPLQAAPAECDAHLLEQRLLSLPKSNDNLFKYEIDNYFKLCGAALSLRNGHNFKALIEGVTTKYDFQDHPDIRSVRFYFKTGETNKGVLALKKDGRPHPLIVVKCGIFCDAEADATVRVVLMHLFDESPFHVLMIGNHTGTNNINSNGRVNIGGFYEGLELFSIGHWAKSKSPFKDFISEVHGVGISLGGSASLFASLYNEYNLLNQEKVFNSFIAYCPVVRLKPALDHLFGDKIRKALASQVIWQQMLSSYPYVRELQNEIDPKHRPESRRFPEILGRLALSFLSRFHPMDFVAPFQGLLIDEASDLWVANDFLKHAQEVSTPTFVWASRNDPVVEARENTESLYRYLQTSPNKAIMTYRVPYGSHCAKSVSYNWDSISTILRSYFF